MTDINYKKCLKQILSEITDLTLTKDGMNIMNKLIDSLYSRFVNYCLESTTDDMDVLIARDAVDELFTGNLKRLVLANGNRILALYNNGMIEYKPHKPDVGKRKKKAKKAIVVEALEFADGIFYLTSRMFPEASLQIPAKRFLCDLLKELAMKISDFVQPKKSDSIALEDIRAALSQLLPPELSKLALAEGAKLTMLFETGMLKETVRKQPLMKAKPKVEPKRGRSPSVKKPIPKRRKIPSARKVSRKKATYKVRQRKAKPKITRRSVSKKKAPSRTVRKRKRSPSIIKPTPKRRRMPSARKISKKRTPSRKVRPKVTPKKRVPRKPTLKTAVKPKISRKEHVPRKAPKKFQRKHQLRQLNHVKDAYPVRKELLQKKCQQECHRKQ